MATSKRKVRNHAYYQNKKMTLVTAASAGSRDNPWAVTAKGTIRKPVASRVAKTRMVKPAVESILRTGNAITQAAVLRGVADHPLLGHARKLAGIESSKEQATIKFVVEQSARMIGRNRSTAKNRGNNTADRRLAAEVTKTMMMSIRNY